MDPIFGEQLKFQILKSSRGYYIPFFVLVYTLYPWEAFYQIINWNVFTLSVYGCYMRITNITSFFPTVKCTKFVVCLQRFPYIFCDKNSIKSMKKCYFLASCLSCHSQEEKYLLWFYNYWYWCLNFVGDMTCLICNTFPNNNNM